MEGGAHAAPDAAPESPIGASRQMAGGVALLAAGRAFVAVASALTTVVVARVIGSSGLGVYAVAQTLLSVLLVLTTLGVEHGIVYYVSSGRWRPASAFVSAQLVAGASGAAAGVLLVLVRLAAPAAIRGVSVGETVMVAIALPFMLSWFFGTYLALAVSRYESYLLPSVVQAALVLVLAGPLGYLDGSTGIVIGILAAHMLSAGVGLRASFAIFGRPRGDVALAELRRAAAFGVKSYAGNALQAVNVRFDLLILSAVTARAVVGHYSVAVSVTTVIWLMPQALSTVLYPRVAALSASSEPQHTEALLSAEAKSLRHGLLVTVVLVAVAALGLAFLVVPVYGSGFRQAIDLGFILLPGTAAYGLASILAAVVAGRGRPGLMLIQALVVTPPTVALYLLLIPSLHATGAALASTVSYAGSFVIVAVFYRRITGRNPLLMMVPTRSEISDYRALAARLWSPLAHRA